MKRIYCTFQVKNSIPKISLSDSVGALYNHLRAKIQARYDKFVEEVLLPLCAGHDMVYQRPPTLRVAMPAHAATVAPATKLRSQSRLCNICGPRNR